VLRWRKGRLYIEIDTVISVPIEIVPITPTTAVAATQIKLTSREQQIFDCLLKGWRNKEIANFVNLAERTVKFHVSSLLRKFKVSSRIELVMIGKRTTNG
jgi:DNA-binding NarL/FixJ family response regulator